jgi:hypothetical protein
MPPSLNAAAGALENAFEDLSVRLNVCVDFDWVFHVQDLGCGQQPREVRCECRSCETARNGRFGGRNATHS